MSIMKLYVWKDDSHLFIALANDSEEARDIITNLCNYRPSELAERPRVYDPTETLEPVALCLFRN